MDALRIRNFIRTLLAVVMFFYFLLAMKGYYETKTWNHDLELRESTKIARFRDRIGQTIKEKFGTKEWDELKFGQGIRTLDKWGLVDVAAAQNTKSSNAADLVEIDYERYEIDLYQTDHYTFVLIVYNKIDPGPTSLFSVFATLLPGIQPVTRPHVRFTEFNSEGRAVDDSAKKG